ncbi:MAG TPA: YidC/Oxa1 family membrane protein insertase [Candidatus Saccharimonadales bacterium]|nr:YidC/Oxa1 family membrane protein insertase [Candidatus Saccharimonadales bacterium]
MFTTLIVQPIFNLLVLIYALLPGHNFGLSIIIFTVIVRFLMYPLLKKQLHQVKVMRKIQPELKRIKEAAKGNKQQEQLMTLELYKERGISPFGPIGIVLLQVPILIGLYSGLRLVLTDPNKLETFSYGAVRHLPWMEQLAKNIHQFDATLFHVVDLTRSAAGAKSIYWPAMLIVAASAIVQFYQSKQLSPQAKDARKLREILKDAGAGKQADQSEVNAAVGRSTRYLLPAMVFLFTVNLPSALALYWLVGGLVALAQQSYLLREDETEMAAEVAGVKPAASSRAAQAIEAEVVESTSTPNTSKPKKSKGKSKAKRRKH